MIKWLNMSRGVKMGLPNYLVNLDELADLIIKAMKDRDIDFKGFMGSKGLLYDKNNPKGVLTWVVPEDMLLTGIKTSYEKYMNMAPKYDYRFSVYIDEELIIDKASIKEFSDYKRLRQFKPILKGTHIDFVVHEAPPMETNISFNLEFIKYGDGFEPIEIKVKCINRLLNKGDKHWLIREFSIFVYPPIIYNVEAPEIVGYTLMDDPVKEVSFAFGDDGVTVYFEYEPDPKKVVVSHVTTTGITLDQFTEIVIPIEEKTYYANKYPAYRLISEPKQTIEVSIGSPSIISVVFYYEFLEPKTIRVKHLNVNTKAPVRSDNVITIQGAQMPYNGTIKAPNISEYKVVGKDSEEVYIDWDSPEETVIIFYYEESEPIVDHDYEYKVVMRWEGGSTSTDIDLHMYLNNDSKTHVYFARMKHSQGGGEMRLDYDYKSHSNPNSYDTRPEIGTVLGLEEQGAVWNIHVHHYTGVWREMREYIDVFIYKYNDATESDIEIGFFQVDPYRLYHENPKTRRCYVCDIDLDTGDIEEIMQYY